MGLSEKAWQALRLQAAIEGITPEQLMERIALKEAKEVLADEIKRIEDRIEQCAQGQRYRSNVVQFPVANKAGIRP